MTPAGFDSLNKLSFVLFTFTSFFNKCVFLAMFAGV